MTLCWSDTDPNDGREQEADTYRDTLGEMFAQQRSFMKLLCEKRAFTQFPVDITSKLGQQECRNASLSGIEEWFESLQHLKNWKAHRLTDVGGPDREKFLEEMSDALHYFIEVIILAGISHSELLEAYMKKGEINFERINKGY